MKYITLFEQQTAFDNAKSTLDKPNMSLVTETGNVYSLAVGGVTYEYVDLGLSVKWAKCNVGAEKETDAGLYFAWGETTGYTASQVGTDKEFSWNDYKYENGGSDLTKYNQSDSKTVLESTDDAASQIMGGDWRMPTQTEWQELLNNTTNEWATINGVSGYKFTSNKEGFQNNSIFIPAAGYCSDGSVGGVGDLGSVWSSSLSTSNPYGAWSLDFSSGNCSMDYYDRYEGRSVRGVRK